MQEFLFFIIGFVIYFAGYYIGGLYGWSAGYDKALEDASKEVHDYFEDKCLCRTKDQDDNTARNAS